MSGLLLKVRDSNDKSFNIQPDQTPASIHKDLNFGLKCSAFNVFFRSVVNFNLKSGE